MKFIHLSDLHLGKRLNEFSLIDDQKYIITKILNIIDEEQPDAVIIAGDVYDKSVPSAEAVAVFDNFLVRLAERKLHVFVISGNHDSAERIAFGSRLMDLSGVHLSPVYSGNIEPFILSDEHGEVCVYMLPFIKPINVKQFYPEHEFSSYTDAIKVVTDNIDVDETKRNIIVTHQFVTGAERSESEDITVGGTDNVDASVFDKFDYVALGHIHSPQSVGRETVRYCGTPLKYSFSEASHKKSVTIVEMGEKGSVTIRTKELTFLHDMREIKGTFAEVTDKSNYEGTNTEDYMHITLTDEDDIPDAIGKLRVIYPNLMKLDYDNKRTRSQSFITGAENVREKHPLELFEVFFENQNGQPMSEEQRSFVGSLIEKIWEEEI